MFFYVSNPICFSPFVCAYISVNGQTFPAWVRPRGQAWAGRGQGMSFSREPRPKITYLALNSLILRVSIEYGGSLTDYLPSPCSLPALYSSAVLPAIPSPLVCGSFHSNSKPNPLSLLYCPPPPSPPGSFHLKMSFGSRVLLKTFIFASLLVSLSLRHCPFPSLLIPLPLLPSNSL